ncbi:MAG: hypothetical protein O3A10_10385 [Chloroflexi bacterium]|nr:hypothetical protein [Chloroflexota bacterium]MDA1146463.1 hypothetical protein [Chloroflexota bacterium]
MIDEQATTRTGFLWAGAIVLIVVVATVMAFMIVVLFGSDNDPISVTPDDAVERITMVTDTLLRSAPAPDVAVSAQLAAGDEVRIIGRSEDGTWIFLESIERSAARGWAAVNAVTPPPDPEALTVIPPDATPTPRPSATATAAVTQPTFTPDLPDLRVESVFSRDNQVIVTIVNAGVVDAIGSIFVSVDGGVPHPADTKPGEPLRPDEQLQILLANEYVQRRAVISATVSTEPAIDESDLTNNTLETVISPDLPNDLGLSGAAFDRPGGALRARLHNYSPIPITGNAVVTVRERTPERTRIGTKSLSFSLAPNGEQQIDFPEIVDREIGEIEIRLSSDAVNDANPSNDVFP